MGLWREIVDSLFGPAELRAALTRARRAGTPAGRLDAARAAHRARPSNETARRLLEDETLWERAFFDRFTEEVERVGSKGVGLEPYRELVAEAKQRITHPRAMAAPQAAILWVESVRRTDNIGLTEAERLLRGFGHPKLADKVKLDIEAVKALGHSGPIRERKAKGLPLPPPTRWSAA